VGDIITILSPITYILESVVSPTSVSGLGGGVRTEGEKVVEGQPTFLLAIFQRFENRIEDSGVLHAIVCTYWMQIHTG
jgi:hypothetical protein